MLKAMRRPASQQARSRPGLCFSQLSDASTSFRTPLGSVNEVASECLLENTDWKGTGVWGQLQGVFMREGHLYITHLSFLY